MLQTSLSENFLQNFTRIIFETMRALELLLISLPHIEWVTANRPLKNNIEFQGEIENIFLRCSVIRIEVRLDKSRFCVDQSRLHGAIQIRRNKSGSICRISGSSHGACVPFNSLRPPGACNLALQRRQAVTRSDCGPFGLRLQAPSTGAAEHLKSRFHKISLPRQRRVSASQPFTCIRTGLQ